MLSSTDEVGLPLQPADVVVNWLEGLLRDDGTMHDLMPTILVLSPRVPE